jgi:hypothetical protein
MRQYETDPNFRAYADAFVRAAGLTGFPAKVGLTMGANESGWFDRLTGDFNFAGVTADPSDNGTVAGQYSSDHAAKFCVTHEVVTPAQLKGFREDEQATAHEDPETDVNGDPIALAGGRVRYSLVRWFASYPSIDASVTAYIDIFTKSPARYKAAWDAYQQNQDEEALLKAICAAGYATGPAESAEAEIFGQSNIAHALNMARQLVT